MPAPGEAVTDTVVTRPPVLGLRCDGCGASIPVDEGPWQWSCPRRLPDDDIDHLLVPELDLAWTPGIEPAGGDSENPFVRYRTLLAPYHLWRMAGRDDASFDTLVQTLDDRVAHQAGSGTGFRRTPLRRFPGLDAAVGARVWVKDETANVGGSHKGRHLFGVAILLAVLDELGRGGPGELAIASCGNAAIAAGIVAAAMGRHLTAFAPADADRSTLDRLVDHGVGVVVCPRDGLPGDPCHRAFQRAVAGGAVPFSCQGPDNGSCLEGMSTLAFEVVEALPELPTRLVVQVGGGALASACVRGFRRQLALATPPLPLPIIDTVQTQSCHPLERAFGLLQATTAEATTAEATTAEGAPAGQRAPVDRRVVEKVATEAAHHRSRYMKPWGSTPASIARGILDDETYDWLVPASAMLETGGTALVVDEATLIEANQLARRATGINVDATGSAGLAGLLLLARAGRLGPDENVVVLFTGAAKAPAPPQPPLPQAP